MITDDMQRERNIRDAAKQLAEAILAGNDAGLATVWPRRVSDLSAIQISDTNPPEPAKPTKTKRTKQTGSDKK